MSGVKLPPIAGASPTPGDESYDGYESESASPGPSRYVSGRTIGDFSEYDDGSPRESQEGSEESEAPQDKADQYIFEGFPAPLDVQPGELIRHVTYKIMLPRKTGFVVFRRFLEKRGPLALHVVEHAFWYLHCFFFHHEDTYPQRKFLMDNLSDLNLTMFLKLPSTSRDFFTEYLPFATASAVCFAMVHLFPGSTEYTKSDKFQNEAYRECRRLFTGVHSCPSVIRNLRTSLNLIEKDPVQEEKKRKALEPTFKEKTNQMIQRLDKMFNLQTIKDSAPRGGGRKQRGSTNDHAPARRMDAMSDGEGSDEEGAGIPFRLKTHPAPRSYRMKFESTGVSPLLGNLGYGKSGTRHIFIKQTQPPSGLKPEGTHKYRLQAKTEASCKSV